MKLFIIELKITFLLLFVLSYTSLNAANRYWVANAASNWNNITNWSTSSGGATGASVPVAGDFVYFNASGTGNCTLDVAVAFDGINTNGYAGVIDLVGFTFDPAVSGAAACTFQSGTLNGATPLSYTTTGNTIFSGMTFGANLDITSGRIAFNGGVFNAPVEITSTGGSNVNGSGACTFNSTLKVTTTGTNYFLMGYSNPDIFNDDVTFINNGTSRIRIAFNSAGNQFNGNITVGSSSGSGVWIGEGALSGSTLANTKQLSIDAGGFSTGELRFKGFVQTGATSSNFSLTGTALLRYESCTFDSDIDVDAPRLLINNSTFNGTSDFEKTSISNDGSAGGNNFVGNCILKNSGAGYFIMGNGSPDVFGGNLDIINSGTYHMYLGYNSVGNTIAGNLTAVQSGTGAGSSSYIFINNNAASTLDVVGNVSVTINGSALNSYVYLGNGGAMTIGGSLALDNSGTGNNSEIRLSNNAGSTTTVSGPATVTNNSTAATTNRIYIGQQGSVTFNNTLDIVNNSGVTNSQIYLNYGSSSTNLYNDDVTVKSSHINSDGIYFGQSGGAGTLAATKTITIPGVDVTNFIGGQLYFRNFTQSGATNQSFELGSTASYLYNYDSDWGGDVNFKAPRIYNRGSIFNGTSYFEKTGSQYDYNVGGNTFTGDAEFVLNNNTANGHLYLSNTTASNCGGDLTLRHIGSFGTLLFGGAGAVHTIGGDVYMYNTPVGAETSSKNIYLGNNSGTTINIAGSLTVVNAPTSTAGGTHIYIANSGIINLTGDATVTNSGGVYDNRIYLASTGVVNFGGNLDLVNSSTANISSIMLANSATSATTVTGNTSLLNSATGSNTRCYLGYSGDVTFNGTLDITNGSSSTTSEIYLNDRATSMGIYNDDITVKSTHVNSDGILFGSNGGNGTLANTKSITIPGVDITNFIGGQLRFKNFTQIGATNHSFELAATATYVYNDNSNWGGDVSFIAPRIYNRETVYSGSSYFEKTGANYDYSYGGNTFTGNSEFILNNSVANGNMYISNNASSTFGGDLTIKNIGSISSVYFGNATGAYPINGDLTLENNGSGTSGQYLHFLGNSGSTSNITGNCSVSNIPTSATGTHTIYFANNGSATIGGNTSSLNAGSGTNNYIYLGNVGSVTFSGDLDIINSSTATSNGQTRVGQGVASTIAINGNTTVLNTATGTTSYCVLGYSGDVTFDGTLDLTNSSGSTNSSILLNYNSNSVNMYNDDITVKSTDINCDGIFFGDAGGSGTLALTKSITIPGVDITNFIGGRLHFENFTQLGPTNHAFELASTANYIYNYNSNWGGDVNFIAPRIYNRTTTYNGSSYFEKTGKSGDDFYGGNTYTGNAEFILNNNEAAGRLLLGGSSPSSFGANLTLKNIGDFDHLYMGNTAGAFPVGGDVVIENSSTGAGSQYIVYLNNAGSTSDIVGSLSIVNNATGATGLHRVYFANNGSVTVGGNATALNSGAGVDRYVYLGASGSIAFGGDLDLTNSSTATNAAQIRMAEAIASTITIAGNTTLLNASTGTSGQCYLGYNGDITFNGTLDMVNSSTSINSSIYLNYNDDSENLYNENITVKSTEVTGDGIRFGESNGSGILAATKTITIPGVDVVNFVGGRLYFRNFTQVGPTNHSFELASTADYIYNYNSDWGGDVDFRAPRIYNRGTMFNGVSYFEKTGAGGDTFYGGNTYTGNVEFVQNNTVNYGSLSAGGSNVSSTCLADLTLRNIGSYDHIYYGNYAGNYTIGGDLSIENNSTGNRNQYAYFMINGASNATVAGDVSLVNNATGVTGTHNTYFAYNGQTDVGGNTTVLNTLDCDNKYVYIGSNGDINFGGNLDIINSATASASSQIRMAEGTNSTIVVSGNTTLANSSTSPNSYCYLGYNGDITFNGTLDLTNSANGTNTSIWLNDRANSVNVYNENITVKSLDIASDGYRFGDGGGSGTLAATKTITIPGVDITNFIGGDLHFENFTQVGATNHSFELAATANYIYNYNADWGGDVNFIAPRIYNRTSIFNGVSYFEKVGKSHDDCYGGNTYTGDAEFILNNNVSAGRLILGGSQPSSFGADLTLKNIGDFDHLYMGNTAGAFPVGGDLVIENSSTGTSSQYIYYLNNAASTSNISGNVSILNNATGLNGAHRIYFANNGAVTINGNTTAINTGGGTDRYIFLGNSGSITFDGDLDMVNSSTASVNAQIRLAENTSSNVSIGGNTTLDNSVSATSSYCYLGNQGDVTFNGTLDMINNSGGTNSTIFLNNGSNSVNVYNGDITLTSINANSDGYVFGTSGSSTLTAGNTISIPGGGIANFISGQLYLESFTQIGATPQTLYLAPTAYRFYNFNSSWDGDVDFRAPRHYTNGTTYNGTSFLEKNGASSDASTGGNTFNGDATIKVTGTGYFMPSNSSPNDFNANATFIKTGTGPIYPSYNSSETFAGDITIDANSTVRLGAAGNGRVNMDGIIAQSINVVGATPRPEFRDLQTSNPNAEITLNTPITILTELDLDLGNIITTDPNLIYMNDNSTVSSVSNAAFVDGPIEKIGNDAFVFPTGDATFYRPISMSNPSSGGARFRATYFDGDPHNDGYHDGQREAGLGYISDCEYWTLDRKASTNNVIVTLHYDAYAGGCSGISDPSLIQVARWSVADQEWKNHGNGGFTTGASGTVQTNGAVTSFSPFTFASLDLDKNPLPIELISFNAKLNGDFVNLNWETASEINNDYFTIERSGDGVSFTEILKQDGAGNSTSILEYADVDYAPLSGRSYYRLKQTDFDGEFTYSNVVSIELKSAYGLTIFPNPTSNNSSFTISATQGNTTIESIEVVDNLGKICKVINSPRLPLEINTTDLPAGLYFVNSFSQQGIISQKLIIQ